MYCLATSSVLELVNFDIFVLYDERISYDDGAFSNKQINNLQNQVS